MAYKLFHFIPSFRLQIFLTKKYRKIGQRSQPCLVEIPNFYEREIKLREEWKRDSEREIEGHWSRKKKKIEK
jgi:hypothetical protein